MLRKLSGIAALISLLVALNVFVWMQYLFSLLVLVPLAVAVLSGVLWLALSLASSSLKTGHGGRVSGGLNATISSLVFLCICMVVFAFARHWDVTWDLTQEGRRDLAPQTVQVLESMTKEVEVTCVFLNIEDELVRIAHDKTLRFLEQCRQYTDLIKVAKVDPQIDVVALQELGLTHASPQGTVVIRAGARQKIIMLSGGSPRLEEREFTNSLINVLRNAQPRICFLTGHQERDILDADQTGGASMLKMLLESEAYQVEPLAITLTEPEIPQDCDILVIAGLKLDLSAPEINALDNYIDQGGRMLILFDPWKNSQSGYMNTEQLRPWLERRFGIQVGSDILMTEQQENKFQVVLSTDRSVYEDEEDKMMDYRGAYRQGHPITQGFEQTLPLVAVRSVRALKAPSATVAATEILRTTPDFWGETQIVQLAETGKAVKDAHEAGGPLPIAVAADIATATPLDSSNHTALARIVVMGDGDLIANNQMGTPGPLNFVLNTMAWLSENEELIAIRPSGKSDPPLILTAAQERAIAWISILFTLQIVVFAGLAVFLFRKRYQ
jgi:hypothetical protein